MLAEGDEVSIIVEENSGSCLLVIRVVAWVEHLDSVLLTLLDNSRGNTVAITRLSILMEVL